LRKEAELQAIKEKEAAEAAAAIQKAEDEKRAAEKAAMVAKIKEELRTKQEEILR